MGALSRRRFVGAAGVVGLGALVVPRHVLGRGFVAPSDKLNIAIVGCGGRGRDNRRGVVDENVVALCDVDTRQAAEARRLHPQARFYADYRELFDREDRNIDAVVISTPDHTHTVIAAAALARRKHVYCEKPLTRTVGEARLLTERARSLPRVATQMGNQGHAGAGVRAFRELIEAGAIGAVREIHYWTNRPIWPQGLDRPLEAFNTPPWLNWDLWLGPAPDRPYAPAYAPFRWRGWWDFGTGALGDIAVHAMDAAYWILDLGRPTRVEPETSRPFDETAPRTSRLEFTFPARGSRPALRVLWRDGDLQAPRPAGLPVDREWPYGGVGSQLWIGDEGSMLADAYADRIVLLDEARRAHFEANAPEERYPRPRSVYAEWLDAAKAGTQPGSSFAEYAGPFTEMVLLGGLAVRLQQVLDIDPATGNIVNVSVPQDYIMPEYRRGWTV